MGFSPFNLMNIHPALDSVLTSKYFLYIYIYKSDLELACVG